MLYDLKNKKKKIYKLDHYAPNYQFNNSNFIPQNGRFSFQKGTKSGKNGRIWVSFRPPPRPLCTMWTVARPLAYNIGNARGEAKWNEKPRQDKPARENAKLK